MSDFKISFQVAGTIVVEEIKRAPPAAPGVRVQFIKEGNVSSNLVTITPPTTRTDGSALALTDIQSIQLSKAVDSGAASVVQTFPAPITGDVTFTDSTPDMGSTDNYSAIVTDTHGNVSPAGTASVVVPPSQLAPPAAPTLTAVFQP
jgi:hypothetical protein